MGDTRGFKVEFDRGQVRRELDGKYLKQVPFMTSLAINKTLSRMRIALVNSLSAHFTIRRGWLGFGIVTQGATKRRLWGAVGSRDPYMRSQAIGGTKTAGMGSEGRRGAAPARSSAGGKTIGIPVGARRSPRSVTPASRWPGNLLTKTTGKVRHFLLKGRDGTGLLYRVTRRKRGGDRWQLMWAMVRRVPVKPRWPFFRIAKTAATEAWPKAMREAERETMRGKFKKR